MKSVIGDMGGTVRFLDRVPNRGIASETCGRVSATRFRNTVSDRSIVTPGTKNMVNPKLGWNPFNTRIIFKAL